MDKNPSPACCDRPKRRAVLTGLAGLIAIFVGARRSRAAETSIVQPDPPSPRSFMARADKMRQRASTSGDQAFGAIVVFEGRIVGQAPSRVVVNGDPTAHAEMEAIRDASRRLGRASLSGCVLYSTSRPCPMCETAARWANITTMIHGSDLTNAGAPAYRRC